MLNRMTNTVCLALLLCVLSVTAQAQTSPLLDNHRWQEYSFGVSILPPLGGQVHKQSADQAILRIMMPQGYAINLFIKQSTEPINLPTVRKQALEQMAGAYPSATVLLDQNKTIHQRDTMALHFFLPRTKQGPWITAQTFVELSPEVFILFQLETPQKSYATAKPIYEAVINSMQVVDPRVLLAEREKLLDAGHALLSRLDYQKLSDRLIPEQWFRFIEGDRDIGYMRIRQFHGPLDDRPNKVPRSIARRGPQIQVMVRIALEDTLFDSINQCYMSDERDEEIWSIRTTERPYHPRKMTRYQIPDRQKLKFEVQEVPIDVQNTWVETGLLSNKKIQLTRHDPSIEKYFEWDIPRQAYLSQVDLYLLPLLLRDEPDGKWGFYAYHPNRGKISFRTERLEHKDNGNYLIYSRLAPDDVQEQITEYDRQGKIVQRILPGGRKLIPTQFRQLQTLWPQFVK